MSDDVNAAPLVLVNESLLALPVNSVCSAVSEVVAAVEPLPTARATKCPPPRLNNLLSILALPTFTIRFFLVSS